MSGLAPSSYRRRNTPKRGLAENGSVVSSHSHSDSAASPAAEAEEATNERSGFGTKQAIITTSASEWMLILSLIFGGCCSNAYSLELATRQLPSSGTLITFAQFLATTLSVLPHLVTLYGPIPMLKRRKVPLYRWFVQVAFYFSTSLLNNMAFACDVPMPVHIVFRSGGLVVNLILGWSIQGTRYTKLQVLSVLLVTAGVVSSTLYSSSDPHAPSAALPPSASAPVPMVDTDAYTSAPAKSNYLTGVFYLFSALVLTGFMGLWQEKTFQLYGNQNWRESLFYSHLLSLPMFAFRTHTLLADLSEANATPTWWFGWGSPSLLSDLDKPGFFPSLMSELLQKQQMGAKRRIYDFSIFLPSSLRRAFDAPGFGERHVRSWGVWIPSFYPPLLLNVATQLLCINGVNRLTSKVNSLTVTLVLVVRKAISLVISLVLVSGSTGSPGLWLGATAVLLGTVGYSVASPPKPSQRKKS